MWHTIMEGQDVCAEFGDEALLGFGKRNGGVDGVGALAAETVAGEDFGVLGYVCCCHA